jgi:hypothetical protein
MRYPATERVTLGEWVMFAAILVAFALSTVLVFGLIVASVVFVIRALRG